MTSILVDTSAYSSFMKGSEAAVGAIRTRTAQVDEETADRYAVIHAHLRRAGQPVPTNDLWIAASAMRPPMPIS